jgi:hypothetical protein
VCHRTAGRGVDFFFFFFLVKQFQVLLNASSELFTLCCCAPEIFSFAKQMFYKIIGICIVVSFNKENNSYSMLCFNTGEGGTEGEDTD